MQAGAAIRRRSDERARRARPARTRSGGGRFQPHARERAGAGRSHRRARRAVRRRRGRADSVRPRDLGDALSLPDPPRGSRSVANQAARARRHRRAARPRCRDRRARELHAVRHRRARRRPRRPRGGRARGRADRGRGGGALRGMASFPRGRPGDRRAQAARGGDPRRGARPRGAAARRAFRARAQGRRDADLADREQAPARADRPREGGRLRAAARALRTARRRRVSTAELYARALQVIPGGVNSPVRAMKAVGLDEPLFARRGEGAYLEDVEGRRFVDWVMSWGPLIFGHADPVTVEAVVEAARDGTTFGTATEREVELAAEIVDAVPSVEMLRLVSSGTEAAMSALRLARAATGREPFVRFAGCYHGHADAFLSEAGSGVATFGISASGEGRVVPYNDLEAVEGVIDGAACVFVEPVAGNMGVVPPAEGFLEGLRRLCDESGALLVFDEVITGFRVARGGAQERYGVLPDLTVLGKIVGGGLPLAAFGGRAELMERLAPAGDVYQAGTLSGNPLATAAGLSVLRRLTPAVYEELERKGQRLDALAEHGRFERVGAMATLFVDDYPGLFRHMLERGIYIAPSQHEAMFLSTAHGDEEIERTISAVADFFK